MLFLNETQVTGDLAANFLKILELALKFLPCLSLLTQLLLQLRDVSSATHLANLGWRRLDLGRRFEDFGHFTYFVLSLLYYLCYFFWSNFLRWVNFNLDVKLNFFFFLGLLGGYYRDRHLW